MRLQRASLFLAGCAALLLATDAARAQAPQEYWKRLCGPASVTGVIGGESHDSYVVYAHKGQTMTVRISWRLVPFDDSKYDSIAQFPVSSWPIFSDDGDLKGGNESPDGTRWTGKLPRTGNYYTFVTGYPTVRYTLKVTVQ